MGPRMPRTIRRDSRYSPARYDRHPSEGGPASTTSSSHRDNHEAAKPIDLGRNDIAQRIRSYPKSYRAGLTAPTDWIAQHDGGGDEHGEW